MQHPLDPSTFWENLMPHLKQQGIIDATTSARDDADVIMSAAIVGHAYARLRANKNCAFDIEANAPGDDDAKLRSDFERHVRAVAKVNKALQVMGESYGLPGRGKEAIVGVTPVYNPQGDIMRITGGSGDLPLDSPLRYNPALPTDLAGSKLYALAKRPGIGYQGRGAYTGFVQGRDGGQSNLFSTYRQRVPDNTGRRWIPSDTQGLEPAIGTGPKQRIWGMVLDNEKQSTVQKPANMYFRDEDRARGGTGLTTDDIVGYPHGMVQAIYDVVQWKLASPGKAAGTPYEIAVGEHTTKLASCFCCAIFMQANDFPASATHLGRGESWSPLYVEGSDPHTAQNKARLQCNSNWANYCRTILDYGMRCIESRLSTDGHRRSMTKLKAYVSGKSAQDYGNLILDAVTVHESEVVRLDRTLQA
jgi:hypothetical protein